MSASENMPAAAPSTTYLVAITPWVVLHPEVVVRVSGAFLERMFLQIVVPVFPVLRPEIVRVDA